MHSVYWNVLVWVLLSMNVALFILGIWELFKGTQLGKSIGIAWLAFAICIGCVAVGLNSTNITWHLRNAQKPWKLILLVNSAMLISGVTGMVALVKVKNLLEVTAGKLPEIETAEGDGVWPPAPRKP